MGFLTPWFLAGAAAVGLPLWLHLLRKHKSTPLPFSSLMFFERRTQSSIKHRRLRYLVLLSMRIALLALLALAFAHPYIMRTAPAASAGSPVTVAAIDNSLSMRAGGRLDEAKEAARSLLGGLRAGQRTQVIAFASGAHLMSEITDDKAALAAAVNAVEATDARGSFAELARTLRSVSQTAKLPLDVHLYSDMQQSGMPASFADLRLNTDIRLTPHAVGRPEPNFAVENVVAPRRTFDNRKSRVEATVAGYGNERATRRVSLLLNGRVLETKAVEVPANGRATVEFLSLETPYGLNKGELKIDGADRLPADDSFLFSVERAEPRRALFVHSAANLRGLLYFQAALEASGQSAFQMEGVSEEQTANLSPAKYAFVVLSDVGNLPGGFENQLRGYVRSGGAALIALGRSSAGQTRAPVSDTQIEETRYSGREGERFQTASWLDAAHPSVLANNRWEDVKFYQAVRVAPGAARVAAKLSDGTPLLIDQPIGEGRVLVFASTFDNVANDFPLHASFVPFVEQTARYLGRLDGGPSSVAVGSFEELRNSKEKGGAVEVVDPKGERVLSLAEAATAQNVQFTQAGFYDVRRPGGRNEVVAVNADRRESDLTAAPAETLALWQNTAQGAAQSGGAAGSEQKPVSLWPYVLLAALAVALGESLLGNRRLSEDKEAA